MSQYQVRKDKSVVQLRVNRLISKDSKVTSRQDSSQNKDFARMGTFKSDSSQNSTRFKFKPKVWIINIKYNVCYRNLNEMLLFKLISKYFNNILIY